MPKKILHHSRTLFATHAKTFSWLLVGQIMAGLLSLLFTVTLANWLTEEAFGLYKYLLTLSALIAVPALTGLSTSTTRAVAKGYEGEFVRSVKLSFRYSWLVIIVGLCISSYYLWQGNQLIGLAVLGATFLSPFLNAFAITAAFLSGKQAHSHFSFFTLSQTLFPSITTLLMLSVTDNVGWLFITYLGTQTITMFLEWRFVLHHFKPHDLIDGKNQHYGTHLSIMNVLGNLSYQSDRFLVWHFLGPVALATYTLALAPAQQLRYLNKTLGYYLLPRLSRHSESTIKQNLSYKFFFLLFIGILTAGTYIITIPFFYKWFLPNYDEAIIYSQLFSLIMLFFPAVLLQEALLSQARQKALYVIQTVIPITKIFLLLILTPLWGIYGVLLTMGICETIRLGLVLLFMYRKSLS